MKALWERGPLFVREIVETYDEPRPHQNTVATLTRILEEKGHVGHEVVGNSHRFYAVTEREEIAGKSLRSIISNFFDNSYKSVVSMLADEEKISAEELRDILKMIEEKSR